MSRAFIREDADAGRPRRRFDLPPRDAPDYDAASARALLEAARDGATADAEAATGYYWGEERLKPHVQQLLTNAQHAGDERMEQVARRFLK